MQCLEPPAALQGQGRAELEPFGAVPIAARVVRDGSFFSGGGVTAGIDMALTVAAELVGQEQAEAIQLNLEYAPAPPFTAGRPETAASAVVALVRTAASASRREREAILGRIAPATA